jgi:hypothetical protein
MTIKMRVAMLSNITKVSGRPTETILISLCLNTGYRKVGRQYSDVLRSPSFASQPFLPPALIFADRLLLFERQIWATFRNRTHGL